MPENEDLVKLNTEIQDLIKNHWLHDFSIDENNKIVTRATTEWLGKCLEPVFNTLFVGKKVIDLDDLSGVYGMLAADAGADVTITNSDDIYFGLIEKINNHLGYGCKLLHQKMVICENNCVYVDTDYDESFNFVLAINFLWDKLYSRCGNFADCINALSYYASDGLIFDWNEVKWANPPSDYNLSNLLEHLNNKYKYVTSLMGGFILALGKK